MFFIFWIFSGLIGYLIGRDKGETWSGAIMGLLLGPIGWLIVYLAKGNRRVCHACKSKIAVDATICPQCRTPQVWGGSS